jgi:DNA-binding transcriptional MocR family regulator
MPRQPGWNPRLKPSRAPRYAALLEALAADIGAGVLRPGDRLPPQRILARSTGLSLGTITRVYAAAEQRGLVKGEVGRGTYVRDLTDPATYSPEPDRTRIDLGPTTVPIEPGDLGQRALQSALIQLSSRADLAGLSGYQTHGGSREQREAGVRWLESLGVAAAPEEVTLTSGAQHGTLLALNSLARGSQVLVEELTYPGLLSAARWLGLEVLPVSMDDDGLSPPSLVRVCQASGARVLYCMPTHHNPTGSVMSLARRRQIVDIARDHDITIIESAALAPLISNPPPALASLAPERTWYVSSMSKATVPALRTGFLKVPAERSQDVIDGVAATLWSVSALLSAVAVRWINDGTAIAIRDARRGEIADRRKLASRVLGALLPAGHPTSTLIWINLPETIPALELVSAAMDHGVLIGPGHLFAASPAAAPNAIRLSLGAAATPADLEAGLTLVNRMLQRSNA